MREPGLFSKIPPHCNSDANTDANSDFGLAKPASFLSSWKFSAFDPPMSQMQLNDFLPGSRRHGGDRAPVLLQYRSSRWFILTTVSVAIFTVGKHSSNGIDFHSQFSSGRFSVRYHRSCCPIC